MSNDSLRHEKSNTYKEVNERLFNESFHGNLEECMKLHKKGADLRYAIRGACTIKLPYGKEQLHKNRSSVCAWAKQYQNVKYYNMQ